MTEQTRPIRRMWSSMTTAASRAARLGDLPVIFMLAWVGWLAVPWSLSGLAQARAAAAASASHDRATEPAHTGSSRHVVAATAPDPAGLDAIPPLPASTGLGATSHLPASSVPTGLGAAPPLPAADDLIARERARIAGEVHDAAGHGLATIAMHAGVALLLLDERPEQARASLEAIRDTSVRALTQLRTALDVIDPGTPAEEDLPRLIDGVRAAGLPIDVEPAEPTVPAHLQGTVYRVVRESLTNVLRHAGPTRALVRVANDPCEFVLEVADRGRGGSGSGEGRGLAGMRARVTAAGGDFSAGPREGGGFRVMARFPGETT
ncbi:sensor histidine kinase [Streptosporangium sp. NPDC000396]|uniref:sensor histidine kinase n=1 Tax=Streptosporangium sp. NPDC000396 TaxID=3366185 RepID=UPI003673C9CB